MFLQGATVTPISFISTCAVVAVGVISFQLVKRAIFILTESNSLRQRI